MLTGMRDAQQVQGAPRDYAHTINLVTAALIAVMVLAFAAVQLYTVPAAKSCIFEKVAGNHAGLGGLAGCFPPEIAWPALLMVQAALLLAAIEAFGKNLGRLAEDVLASDRKTLFLLIGAVAVLTSFYLARGDVLLGDAYVFQPAAEIFKDAMGEGIPHHSFYWYGGSSHFEYYGQLYFGLAAAADFIFNNINLTIKVVNWLLHIAAAVVVYLLVLEWTRSRKASFIAALAYSVSYEHIARIMLHGRLMNSLIYALVPLLILLIEKAVSGKGKTAAAASASLAAAAIFLASPGDGIFVLIPAAAYLAIRLAQLPQRRASIVKTAALSGVLFLAMTSFWIVPFLLEKASFNAGARIGDLTSTGFAPGLLKEMISFPGQRGISPIYYLGVLQIILALFAAAQILKQKKGQALLALALLAAISFILTLFHSPRYAPVLVLALAALAGIGSQLMAAKTISRAKVAAAGRVFIIISALIILDSAGSLIQPDYPDFSAEKRIISESIPAAGGFRSIDLHSDRRTFYPSLTYLATKTESVFGPLLEGAPKSTNYALAIATKAAKEYYDEKRRFSEETLDGLYLFNVKYVVLHPEQTGSRGRNLNATLGLEQQIAVRELESSPVIAAREIARYGNDGLEREENYFLRPKFEAREINYGITDEITETMGINRQKATAETILVKEEPAAEDIKIGSEEEREGVPELQVTATVNETRHSRVRLQVEQNSDAFLQLSYSASPELSVFVDGKKVVHYRTAVNTVAIRTAKGSHSIEVRLSPSRLRKALFAVAAAAAAVSVAILISRRQRREA